jgi:hypothetical protein
MERHDEVFPSRARVRLAPEHPLGERVPHPVGDDSWVAMPDAAITTLAQYPAARECMNE